MNTTALTTTHQLLNAKMVDFAGYYMPVSYTSIKEEHFCVRNGVGVFDVSHMGEFILEGNKALELIQEITSNDASKLAINQAQYSCMPNDKGGIVDDLLVYRKAKHTYLLVVNAANIEKDWQWIKKHNTEKVKMQNISKNTSLLAVQGPKAIEVLQQLTDIDLSKIKYYTFCLGRMADIDNVLISATGYTGSGGFELYVPNTFALRLWDAIFDAGKAFNIQPIGLGARDTLRLEMGYCLYGNDIDDTTNPIEAGLGWITKFTKSFVGDSFAKTMKTQGVQKKLVGFEMLDRGIARQSYSIENEKGENIGRVTSGTQGLSVDKSIGMGYVSKEYSTLGSIVFILVRKKRIQAKIVKMPFYKS